MAKLIISASLFTDPTQPDLPINDSYGFLYKIPGYGAGDSNLNPNYVLFYTHPLATRKLKK